MEPRINSGSPPWWQGDDAQTQAAKNSRSTELQADGFPCVLCEQDIEWLEIVSKKERLPEAWRHVPAAIAGGCQGGDH